MYRLIKKTCVKPSLRRLYERCTFRKTLTIFRRIKKWKPYVNSWKVTIYLKQKTLLKKFKVNFLQLLILQILQKTKIHSKIFIN